MTTRTNTGWSTALAATATEFSKTPLTVLEGQLPSGLCGSLYRNGPARLERNGQRVGHWFDGDGAVLGVRFGEEGASGVYRFVQTEGLKAEERAGRFFMGGYGTRPSGRLWKRLGGNGKNAANISVLAVQGKLLALWEGGLPYAMNPDTLETIGPDRLGDLAKGNSYSAHPKEDPQTGDIYNFGVQYGSKGILHLYRSDRTGCVVQKGTVVLDELPMIHDFLMAGDFLVFFISPLRLNPVPLLAGLKSYSECLTWDDKRQTMILVIDRRTLTEVARNKTLPFFSWHFGNGAVDADGNITVDYVHYRDFAVNEALGQVASGKVRMHAPGTLHRARLASATAAVLSDEQVLPYACEFPEVDPRQVGGAWRYTYLAVVPEGDLADDYFSAVGRFDHKTGEFTLFDTGHAVMEPIYAPDAKRTDGGWLLTVVYDSNRHQSEVWVFDANNLAAGPLCRLGLPEVIPMGFHGTWHAA